MAKTNVPRKPVYTHEGGIAAHVNPEYRLRRSVMSCLLWEKEFYEDGIEIAKRISELVLLVKPEKAANIAIEARESMNLRHVPLWIVRAMAKFRIHKHLVASTLARIIQRPDELTEFLSLYWSNRRQPLSAQVKKGLAQAFTKFDEYQLAKYNRDSKVKLKDVLFLSHAKPKNDDQAKLWKRLINNELAVPDTWEVALSSGENKKDAWQRLLETNKLGAMALLRNLRNMENVGVSKTLVASALDNANVSKVLPFRFISAAKAVPQWEDIIEPVLMRCLGLQEKLPGKTILIVDVSGSMYGSRLSKNSSLDRANTACALAVVIREICEDPRIYATAGYDGKRIHKTEIIPPRRGFALADAIYGMCGPLGGGGIFVKQVMDYVHEKEKEADRIIVITDEQDCSASVMDAPARAKAFGKTNYMINVASAKNGVGYGKWTHIDGWSDAVVKYILEYEKNEGNSNSR